MARCHIASLSHKESTHNSIITCCIVSEKDQHSSAAIIGEIHFGGRRGPTYPTDIDPVSLNMVYCMGKVDIMPDTY